MLSTLAAVTFAQSSPAPASAAQPSPAQPTTANDRALQRAQRLLRSTILVDGHNDLPYTIRESTAAPRDVVAYDLRRPTPVMDIEPDA